MEFYWIIFIIEVKILNWLKRMESNKSSNVNLIAEGKWSNWIEWGAGVVDGMEILHMVRDDQTMKFIQYLKRNLNLIDRYY